MRVSEKLRAGDAQVSIGYFGGSITAGVGASDRGATSWRARTTRWFRERFPRCEIREINACLEGTGSELAAFRVGDDLLRHRPDVVFIEYAVNDHRLAAAAIVAALEGVLRRCRRALPEAEIVLVLATMRQLAERFPGMPPSAHTHATVARHYGIPVIDVGGALVEAIASGAETWETLTTDGCHPTDAGQALYAREVRSFLEEAIAQPPGDRLLLPDPLADGRLEWGRIVPVAAPAPPGWRFENKPVGPYLRGRIVSDTPGAELAFPFAGDAVGLYWLAAPDCGAVDFSIDGTPRGQVTALDERARVSSRARYRLLARGLPGGPHILALRACGESKVRIGAFLIHESPILA